MTASLVARLIEAGTPAELVAEVAMELGAAKAAKDAVERKRAADRDRIAEKRRATSRESGDVGDVAPTPQNVPPHPPINSPISEPNGSALAPDGAIDDPTIAERELFDRGKRVLGPTAGGMVAKLKAHFGGNVALARAAIETASTKHDPRQYVGALLRGRAPPGGSNVVTLDASTGLPIHDHQPFENRDDPTGRSFGSGPRGRQTAAFLEGFCRGPER